MTFTCSAGAANPVIQNYTLYQFFAGVTYSSSNQVGTFNQTQLTEGLYNYVCEASNSLGSTPSCNRTVEVQGEFNSQYFEILIYFVRLLFQQTDP